MMERYRDIPNQIKRNISGSQRLLQVLHFFLSTSLFTACGSADQSSLIRTDAYLISPIASGNNTCPEGYKPGVSYEGTSSKLFSCSLELESKAKD